MPGTPIAKSHSLSSVNCFTCFGFISCSASVFRSSGLSGGKSSGCRSPLSRSVGGRPTLRCRSDALTCTSRWSTALKLKVPADAASIAAADTVWVARGALAIGIDPEKHLSVLDRLRVLREHFLHDAGVLGLDLVHDLHRFDDAERLRLLDAVADGDVRLGAGLRGAVERADHRRLHLEER